MLNLSDPVLRDRFFWLAAFCDDRYSECDFQGNKVSFPTSGSVRRVVCNFLFCWKVISILNSPANMAGGCFCRLNGVMFIAKKSALPDSGWKRCCLRFLLFDWTDDCNKVQVPRLSSAGINLSEVVIVSLILSSASAWQDGVAWWPIIGLCGLAVWLPWPRFCFENLLSRRSR